MEWKDLLLELVELVKNASELAWVIGNRQVMVHAIQYCVWGGVVGYVSIYLFRLAKRLCKKDYAIEGIVFSYFSAVGTAIFALSMLAGAFGMFVNPNYYTIRLLIALAQGR